MSINVYLYLDLYTINMLVQLKSTAQLRKCVSEFLKKNEVMNHKLKIKN